MKDIMKIFSVCFVLFILVGCVGNSEEERTKDSADNSNVVEDSTDTDQSPSTTESEELDTEDENDSSSIETDSTDSDSSSSEDSNDILSQYSSEQIEYARVWLQLGPNQEIDELNVRHISAGEPLDPEDDASVSYPEDVIQLRGSRLVDGMVTYSGNGDGTINVYNVPISWYGGFPSDGIDKEKVREDMENIIENPELVYVDPGDDVEVIELIEMINIHN